MASLAIPPLLLELKEAPMLKEVDGDDEARERGHLDGGAADRERRPPLEDLQPLPDEPQCRSPAPKQKHWATQHRRRKGKVVCAVLGLDHSKKSSWSHLVRPSTTTTVQFPPSCVLRLSISEKSAPKTRKLPQDQVSMPILISLGSGHFETKCPGPPITRSCSEPLLTWRSLPGARGSLQPRRSARLSGAAASDFTSLSTWTLKSGAVA